MFFGKKLRELRIFYRFGIRDFANKINMLPSDFIDMEYGRIPPPQTEEWFCTIIKVLGIKSCSPEEFELYELWKQPFVMQKTSEDLTPVFIRSNDNHQFNKNEITNLKDWINDCAKKHNKKITAYEIDSNWAELRDKKQDVIDLISGNNESSIHFNIVLALQCLTTILTDIDLHEKYFLSVDEEFKKYIKSCKMEDIVELVKKENYFWNIIEDKTKEQKERIDAIHKLRKRVWGYAAFNKNDIVEVICNFPSNSFKEICFVLHCASLVVIEINLREAEIKIINND